MGMRFSWCFSGVVGGRERETSPFQLVSAFPLRGADYVNIDKPTRREKRGFIHRRSNGCSQGSEGLCNTIIMYLDLTST